MPKIAVVEVVEVLSEVVVSSSEVVVDADEPPSSLPQAIIVRLKRSTSKMCKILFIFSSTLVSVEITWGLLRWNVGVFF